MADNYNGGWSVNNDQVIIDGDQQNTAPVNRDNLVLHRINENGTIGEMVDTINENFKSIAMHGGGPSGMDGINGFDGADGTNVEYIYALSDEMEAGTHYPTDSGRLRELFEKCDMYHSHRFNNVTWYDHAQPISKDHPNEYVFSRFRRTNDESSPWYYAEEPVLWAHWGETGKDGDGVEYIFRIYDHELTDDECRNAFSYIDSMDNEMKAIYNIDDFYPGTTWFNATNKSKAEKALKKAGLYQSDSYFDTRWTAKFNFCDNGSWTDDPTGTGYGKPYEYVSVRRSNVEEETDKKEWSKYSEPALWSKYSFEGRIFIIYRNMPVDQKPSVEAGTAPKKGDGWWDNKNGNDKLIFNPASNTGAGSIPEGWTDDNLDHDEGELSWMCSGIFDHTGKNVSWSNPTCISGKDGKNGEDGTNIEFIYALSDTMSPGTNYPTTERSDDPSVETMEKLFNAVENDTHTPKSHEYHDTVWYDRAQPIRIDARTEYIWSRRRENEDDPWEYDPSPVLWAHWGEDGTDGDGVEYIFTTTTEDIPDNQLDTHSELRLPKYSALSAEQKKLFQIDDFVPSKQWFNKVKNGVYVNKAKAEKALGREISDTEWTGFFGFGNYPMWTDNPIKVNPMEPYQWVSIRRSTADEHDGKRFWEDFGTPALWSSYGKSTRVFIIYCNMTSDDTPEDPKPGFWFRGENVSKLVNSSEDHRDYKSNALHIGEPDYDSNTNYWADKNVDVENTITWLCSGVFTDDGKNVSWSDPYRITGPQGEKGADGTNIEYVYCLSESEPACPKNGTYDQKCEFFHNVETADSEEWAENPNGFPYSDAIWFDNPQGIENEDGKRTEWMWMRSKPANATEDTKWDFAPAPVIWSHWGEDGTDGDGVEYIFYRSTENPLLTTQLPINKSELSTNVQKAIYNIGDFYAGPGWFTTSPVNHKEQAKQALIDAGIYTREQLADGGSKLTEFNELWDNKFGFRIVGGNTGPYWTDNPTGADLAYPFEWVSIRKSHPNSKGEREWDSFGTPTIWTKYNMKTRIFIVYCCVPEGTPVDRPQGGWWDGTDDGGLTTNKSGFELTPPWTDSDNSVPGKTGKISYLSSGLFAENGRNISWSAPFRMTGEKGKPGADGSTIEFVYCLSEDEPQFPKYDGSSTSYDRVCVFFESVEGADSDSDLEHDGYVYSENGESTEWFDNPQGIEDVEGKRKEWVWSRSKTAANESTNWTFPEKPVIWAHWGEDGTDGDGVEYIFSLGNSAQFIKSPSDWNAIWNNAVFKTETGKAAYSMDDFIPNESWFTTPNYNAVKTVMEEVGQVISTQHWENLQNYIRNLTDFGLWTDNPSSVTPSNIYQYVSIRKMSDGEWQPFSYPKVWAKYSLSQYKAFAFVATPLYINLENYQPTGGRYDNPVPDDDTFDTVPLDWTDGPEATDSYPLIWMTSALVKEETPNSITWSKPQRMVDTGKFQIEWSETDKTIAELITINSILANAIEGGYTDPDTHISYTSYDFDEYLKKNNDNENAAETAWRKVVNATLGINFSDNSTKAILMATCEVKNNEWGHWTVNRVKGEQGEAGSSLNVTGHITYERYLPSDATYTKSDVETFMGTPGGDPDQWPSNPKNDERLMVFPHEPNEYNIYAGDYTGDLDGALYMWKYNTTTHQWEDWNDENTNGEQIGNTYTCPINGHLILWDGDSWQDVGNIKGPAGPINKILVRFADDDPQDSTKKVFVSDENIPSAKWVGFLTYTEGTEEFQPIENPNGVSTDGANNRWVWSYFKGQDGYGFEYIFKATTTNTPSSNIPNVPQQPANDNWRGRANVVPTSLGWSDEPIQPDETNKFVWMCWRKYDASEREWTDFMGNSANPGKARLWQVYARSIVTVEEYYHADASMSPSPVGGYDWFNCKDTTRSGWDSYWKSKTAALEDWDDTRRYLFNVEVVTYSDGTPEVLDPHFIAIYASGLYDIKEFYCLDRDGETVPNVTGGKVILDNDEYHLPSSKVAQVSAGLISSENEGKLYWTTNAKKATISAFYPYLWNISYMMYDDSSKDGWSDPYVIGVYGKGDNGTDSIYVDLDNEMDAIQIKDNKDSNKGTVVNNGTYTAILRLYKGSTLLKIRECDVANEDKFDGLNNRQSFKLEITDSINVETPTWTIYNQQSIENGFEALKMTIDLRANDVITNPYNSKIQFTVTSVDGDVRMASYTAVFTTNPTVYSIVLSDTELVEKTVTQNNQNVTVIDPDPLSLYVRAQSGLTVLDPIRENVSGKYKLDVYLNGSMITSLLSNPYLITSSDYTTLSLKADDRLTFAFNAYINGTAYEMDRETVFVLKEGKDGQPGAAGNGYQYCYVRYDKSKEGTGSGKYNGETSVSVSQTSTTVAPTFTIGGVTLTSTSEPVGVDSSFPYEYRSERSGYGASNASTWSKWSTPVTIATYLDDTTIRTEAARVANEVVGSIRTGLNNATSTIASLTQWVDPSTGYFAGSISDSTMAGIITAVTTSNSFTGAVKNTVNGMIVSEDGVTTFADWLDETTQNLGDVRSELYGDGDTGGIIDTITVLDNKVGTATTAVENLTVRADNKFAQIENTVANTAFIKDTEGYLLVDVPEYTVWHNSLTNLSGQYKDEDEHRNTTWVLFNGKDNATHTISTLVPLNISNKALTNEDGTKVAVFLKKYIEHPSTENFYSNYFNGTTFKDGLSNRVTISNVDIDNSNYVFYDVDITNNTGIYSGIGTSPSPTTSSRIEITMWAIVDVKSEAQTNLTWNVGISNIDGDIPEAGIYYFPDGSFGFAYANTSSVFEEPLKISNVDVISHLNIYKQFGYTVLNKYNSSTGIYTVEAAPVNGDLSVYSNMISSSVSNMRLIPVNSSISMSTVMSRVCSSTTTNVSYINNNYLTSDTSIAVGESKDYWVVRNYNTTNKPQKPFNYTVAIPGNDITFNNYLIKDRYNFDTPNELFTDFTTNNTYKRQYVNTSLSGNTSISSLEEEYSIYTTSPYDKVKLTYYCSGTKQTNKTTNVFIYVYYRYNNSSYAESNRILVRSYGSTNPNTTSATIKDVFEGLHLDTGKTLHFKVSVKFTADTLQSLDFRYKFETTNNYIFDDIAINLIDEDETIYDFSQDVYLVGYDYYDYSNTEITSTFNPVEKGRDQDLCISICKISTHIKDTRAELTFSSDDDSSLYYMVVPYEFDVNAISYLQDNCTGMSYIISGGFLNNSYLHTENSWSVCDDSPSRIIDFKNAYYNGSEYVYTIIQYYNNGDYNFTSFLKANMLSQSPWTYSNDARTTSYVPNTYMIDSITVTVNDRSRINNLSVSRRRAKNSLGQFASTYLDVCEADKPYLIATTTELANISQTVGDGIASTEIIVGVGENAATQIFQATKDGSQIYLNANEIGIESDYFKLNNDGLSMRGNLYAMDAEGNITAGVIGEDNPGMDDIKFFAGTSVKSENTLQNAIKSAPFRVYENGHVVANDFEIAASDESIKINQYGLSAIANKTISNDVLSGELTKFTNINSDMFSIKVLNGTYTADSTTYNVSENEVYIKIVDRLYNPNSNVAGSPFVGQQYLYGVPTLCMKYRSPANGELKEYILSPATWIENTTVNSTNMRWMHAFGDIDYRYTMNPNVIYYSLKSLVSGLNNTVYSNSSNSSAQSITNILGSTYNGGLYYVYNPDNRRNVISGGDTTAEICKFNVENIGSNEASVHDLLYRKGLTTYAYSASANHSIVDINNGGVYAIRDNNISNGDYGPGAGKSITEVNCDTFVSYLSQTISDYALIYNCSYPLDSVSDFQACQFSCVSNIYGFVKYASGALRSSIYSDSALGGNDSGWHMNYNGHSWICSLKGLFDNLSFDTDGYYTNDETYIDRSGTLNISYYPIITISNSGKNLSNYTKYVWIKCSAEFGNAYFKNSKENIYYVFDGTGGGSSYSDYQQWQGLNPDEVPQSGILVPQWYTSEVGFEIVLDLSALNNGNGLSFIPTNSTSVNALKTVVNTFLSNFNFTKLNPNQIYFSTGFSGRYDDNYNNSTTFNFSKTSFFKNLN